VFAVARCADFGRGGWPRLGGGGEDPEQKGKERADRSLEKGEKKKMFLSNSDAALKVGFQTRFDIAKGRRAMSAEGRGDLLHRGKKTGLYQREGVDQNEEGRAKEAKPSPTNAKKNAD